MPPIVEVPVRSRSALISLFEEHRRDRAFIDCVLEGHFGTARADRVSAPTVARLDCRPFTAFAGDPTSRDADALVRCAPIDWVTPDTDAWRELLLRVFADRIRVTPFVAFSSASLDVAALERHTRSVEDGYELCRLDAALSHRLLTDMKKAWLLESYASLDDFLRRGIGYVAVHEGNVVASATSAVTSARAIDIDIDIETAPAHRRIGLATAVGAALALECLVRGIDPLWLASNDASCRLAEKLGYARVDRYETFEIAE